VLIVDDNEINRRVVHEQCTSWGMVNGSYAGSRQALDEVRRAAKSGRPYHFVIADFHMPDMDGAGLASAIKNDPETSATVIVILTSIGSWREVRGMEGAGVDACLIKPVRQSQLFQALSGAWGRRLTQSLAAISQKVAASGDLPEDPPLRVLVADDNVGNQKVAIRMLEDLGLRADVAANGHEAVELLKLMRYDLILMDCQMPEMSGPEAVAEIRRRESGALHPTPIVSMAGDRTGECQQQCLRCGMDDIMHKPIRASRLAEVVRKWTKPSILAGLPEAIPASKAGAQETVTGEFGD
jgi:CheY-like chemotaxis protein